MSHDTAGGNRHASRRSALATRWRAGLRSAVCKSECQSRGKAVTNVEKLRHAYREWHDTCGRSVATWLDLLDDDVELKSLAGGASEMMFTAPRRGKAAVEAYFAEMLRDWEMLSFAVDDFVAEGDQVVAVGRCAWRHRGTGKAVDTPTIGVWRFK